MNSHSFLSIQCNHKVLHQYFRLDKFGDWWYSEREKKSWRNIPKLKYILQWIHLTGIAWEIFNNRINHNPCGNIVIDFPVDKWLITQFCIQFNPLIESGRSKITIINYVSYLIRNIVFSWFRNISSTSTINHSQLTCLFDSKQSTEIIENTMNATMKQ